MNLNKDYYAILGVRPNAKPNEIDLAYKGRRSQYHPDKYATSDAETRQWATERMQEINEAYGILSDASMRREYDSNRSSRPSGPSQESRDNRASAQSTQPPSTDRVKTQPQPSKEASSKPANSGPQGKTNRNKKSKIPTLIFWIGLAFIAYKLYGNHKESSAVENSTALRHQVSTGAKVVCSEDGNHFLPPGSCAIVMPNGEIGDLDDNNQFVCRFRCIDSPHPAPAPESLNSPSASRLPPASVVAVAPSAAPVSSTTSWLSNFIIQHTGDTDCGEWNDLYCKADLIRQAARLAYDDSIECDRHQSNTQECSGNGQDFFDRDLHDLEVRTLTQKKSDLQKYLVANNSNLNDPRLQTIARPCEQHALDGGMRGDNYWNYVRNTCLTDALNVVLAPQKKLLGRVEARLQQLTENQDTDQTASSTAPTASVMETRAPMPPAPTAPTAPAQSTDRVGSQTYETSFDCAKARTQTEELICHDADLASADKELGHLYQRAQLEVPDHEALTQQMRAKLKYRDRVCHDKPCLMSWYFTLINALKKLATSSIN